MAIEAKIRFRQGLNVGPAGEAFFGVLGTPVIVENASNLGVENWSFEVVDVPTGSVVGTGLVQDRGTNPTYSFNPDTRGGYLITLIVRDKFGNVARDTREFGVPLASGRHIPSFLAIDKTLNYSGNARGWAKYMEQWLLYLDMLGTGGGATSSKEPVRLATGTNHALSGLAAIGGVTPLAGNRVAVFGQTLPEENGLYAAAAGAWARTPDADVAGEFATGFMVAVQEGQYAGAVLMHLTLAPITVGTTPIILFVFVPPRANVAGAVMVEDPANGNTKRRLRQADIDPDFNIASWSKTAPNGGTLLYRRGDAITGITGAATYVSGPPTSATVTNTFGGSVDGADVDPGVWTINSPFATASLAGTVQRFGANAGADPFMSAGLQAISAPFTRNASWSIFWTSDVYFGTFTGASVLGTDVYNGGLQAGFSDSLQQGRTQTRLLTPTGTQYLYFLWPDEGQYTAGTETFKDNVTGFVFPMSDIGTVNITRNGVTRTYRVWRSDNLVNTAFTIAVT